MRSRRRRLDALPLGSRLLSLLWRGFCLVAASPLDRIQADLPHAAEMPNGGSTLELNEFSQVPQPLPRRVRL